MRKDYYYSPNQIAIKTQPPPSLTAFNIDHVSQYEFNHIAVMR